MKQQVSLTHYLKQRPHVLRHLPNYRRFLLSYASSKLGAMAIGFFLVYGDTRFNLNGAQVGLLTGVLIAGQAVMNIIWGWVGDRSGHKVVLIGSAFALALAALTAWLASSITALTVTFALVGAAIAGDDVSKFNIILEFATPEEHPTYIGLTNTLLAPVVTLAPILRGWLATWLGYHGMFVVAMTISTLGGLLLAIWVQEPRHVRPPIMKR